MHQTKFPARRRFTYRRSRPQTNITDGFALMDGSINNDKDVTTNVTTNQVAIVRNYCQARTYLICTLIQCLHRKIQRFR